MLIISVTHFFAAELISYSELNSFMSCLGELFVGVEKPHMHWIIYGTTPFHVILMHTPERSCHPFAVFLPGDRVPPVPSSSSIFFSSWKTNQRLLYGQLCSHHQLTMSNREHWNVCPKELCPEQSSSMDMGNYGYCHLWRLNGRITANKICVSGNPERGRVSQSWVLVYVQINGIILPLWIHSIRPGPLAFYRPLTIGFRRFNEWKADSLLFANK